MFAFVCRQQNVLTKRDLVTRRIKASQILQSIVCAFRSIAGAATAEKLVLSHCLQYKCERANFHAAVPKQSISSGLN